MAETRTQIRFLLNGHDVSLPNAGTNETLLDWLRLQQRLTGTKEGCAEGDCGACTVLVGRLGSNGLVYETVNACIRFLASLDGCHVVTVEHLVAHDGGLHPVQQAMVDHHGSQCGFCTPGIVMSLYALWMQTPSPTRAEAEIALQGNLCRCTGYRPIIDAACNIAASPDDDVLVRERMDITARLEAMRDGKRVETTTDGSRVVLPASEDDLLEVLADTPEAQIVAGATDVGLWVTKHMRDISPAVHIGHLTALQDIVRDESGLRLGCGVSYSDARAAMLAHVPGLGTYWDRIGGWQVRNMGTIGGNIANGSPIGDTPPVLIALDASVVLKSAVAERTMPLEAFFIAYGKQARDPSELVRAVLVPPVADGALTGFYKISKRRDEDISAVAAGFVVRLDGDIVAHARLAFGGMAGTPKRALAAETALVGQPWELATLRAAQAALAEDFTPLSDWRASAQYRMQAARGLLERFFRAQSGETVDLERVS